MIKGGMQDWPEIADAGKRAIAQTIDGQMLEGRLALAEYIPGEDRPIPLFNLATKDGAFIDWAELQGWALY